jgi:hypothetical protein
MRQTILTAMTAVLLASAGSGMAAEVDHSAAQGSASAATDRMSVAAKMDHAAMGHGAAATDDGPWSYKSRKNPEPTKTGRWEMVPVPGYGHMFISTQGLSKDLACAALDNPGVMVDRATRKACALPPGAAVPATNGAAPVVDHSKMKH